MSFSFFFHCPLYLLYLLYLTHKDTRQKNGCIFRYIYPKGNQEIRVHETRMYHRDTLSWYRASQSWVYPLNVERLARKQPVPMLRHLVWRSRGSNSRPPNFEANALCTRPPSRFNKMMICHMTSTYLLSIYDSLLSQGTIYIHSVIDALLLHHNVKQ